MKKKIILASTSPRRSEILKTAGIEFEIIPSKFEEVFDNYDFEYKKIEEFAKNKALAVANSINQDALVIGADTVVVFDNKILGKPKDESESLSMLQKLSNNSHLVVTSICITDVKSKLTKISSVTSKVEFNNLSEKTIKEYVDKFKPLDKAGSYGIQELPEGFIKNIEGSFENIIGLCSDEVKKMLRDFAFVTTG